VSKQNVELAEFNIPFDNLNRINLSNVYFKKDKNQQCHKHIATMKKISDRQLRSIARELIPFAMLSAGKG